MSVDNEYDYFDEDDLSEEKFSKFQKNPKFSYGREGKKDNWRDKRRSKENNRKKFFEK